MNFYQILNPKRTLGDNENNHEKETKEEIKKRNSFNILKELQNV